MKTYCLGIIEKFCSAGSDSLFSDFMKTFSLFFAVCFLSACGMIPDPKKGNDSFFKFMGFNSGGALSVTSMLPKSDSTGIPINTNIFVGLSRVLSSFDSSQVSITDADGQSASGKTELNGNIIQFTPAAYFKTNTKYTVLIKKETGLSSDYKSVFSTGSIADTSAPSVKSSSPENNETDFPLNAVLTVNFSETLDPTSVNSSSFTITGGIAVARSTEDSAAFMKPSANLPEGSPFIVTVKAGIKDLAGNKSTAPYSILFSTGSRTVASECTYDAGAFENCLYK